MEGVGGSGIGAEADGVAGGIIEGAVHQLIPLGEAVHAFVKDLDGVGAIVEDAIAHKHAALIRDGEGDLVRRALDGDAVEAPGDERPAPTLYVEATTWLGSGRPVAILPNVRLAEVELHSARLTSITSPDPSHVWHVEALALLDEAVAKVVPCDELDGGAEGAVAELEGRVDSGGGVGSVIRIRAPPAGIHLRDLRPPGYRPALGEVEGEVRAADEGAVDLHLHILIRDEGAEEPEGVLDLRIRMDLDPPGAYQSRGVVEAGEITHFLENGHGSSCGQW